MLGGKRRQVNESQGNHLEVKEGLADSALVRSIPRLLNAKPSEDTFSEYRHSSVQASFKFPLKGGYRCSLRVAVRPHVARQSEFQRWFVVSQCVIDYEKPQDQFMMPQSRIWCVNSHCIPKPLAPCQFIQQSVKGAAEGRIPNFLVEQRNRAGIESLENDESYFGICVVEITSVLITLCRIVRSNLEGRSAHFNPFSSASTSRPVKAYRP